LKPAFGGNVVAEIISKTHPQMATVRPGMLTSSAGTVRREPRVIRIQFDHGSPLTRHLASHVEIDPSITPLEEADVVIGIGMGVGGQDEVNVVLDLARRSGASVCGSRRVVDQGWLPRQVQVGLTGKGIKCSIYLAMGIRGSPNHTIGLRGVNTIIAVNIDPDAPIFQCADIGFVGDCRPIISAIVDEFSRKDDCNTTLGAVNDSCISNVLSKAKRKGAMAQKGPQ